MIHLININSLPTCSDQYKIYCDLELEERGRGCLPLEGLEKIVCLFQTCGGLTFPIVLYHSTENIGPWNTVPLTCQEPIATSTTTLFIVCL